jgi:uncharacterized RDD family membrane protein YckC
MARRGNKKPQEYFMSDSSLSDGPVSAGPLRRFGAMLYDTLIVIALQFVATLPFLPFLHGRVLMASEVGALAYFYHAWQVLVIVLFFGFFWTRNGRTLGTQAWRLRVEKESGALPSWRDAIMRLLFASLPWLPAFAVLTAAEHFEPRQLLLQIGVALLGLGLLNYLAAYIDPRRRSWHDRFLRTRVVRS